MIIFWGKTIHIGKSYTHTPTYEHYLSLYLDLSVAVYVCRQIKPHTIKQQQQQQISQTRVFLLGIPRNVFQPPDSYTN